MRTVLRLVRFAILLVLVFWQLSIVVALGRPETGPVEDIALLALVLGLFALARPVRRIGVGVRAESM